MRIIAHIPSRENTDAECDNLNIMPLHKRGALHLIQHGRWMEQSGNYSDARVLSTRSNAENRHNLKLELPRKELYHKSFVYHAIKLWNGLSTELQFTVDDKIFNKRITELLRQDKLSLG